MARFFHGTSANFLDSILRNGLCPNHKDKSWTCSNFGVYLWSFDKVRETYFGTDDVEDYAVESTCLQNAYDNAMVTAATQRHPKCVVFEIELDEELKDDYSCLNMDGAVVCNRIIKPQEIKRLWVSGDLTFFMPAICGWLLSNPLFEPDAHFSKAEQHFIKKMSTYEIEFPELSEEVLPLLS